MILNQFKPKDINNDIENAINEIINILIKPMNKNEIANSLGIHTSMIMDCGRRYARALRRGVNRGVIKEEHIKGNIYKYSC